jgi:hypothetical protein
MSFKFTLGEKLTSKRDPQKPVGSTCEKYAGRIYREPCGCGRGFIEYEYGPQGQKRAKHRICTWGRDLSGQLEMAACCETCAKEQDEELDRELYDEADYE